MTDTSDKKPDTPRSGGGTLTLKRPAVEQSRVKQNFAHGRTKSVVVETKRKRFGDERPQAPAETKVQFQTQPKIAMPLKPAQTGPTPTRSGRMAILR